METFCWDFVQLSKASSCERRSIPVYCLTVPLIYGYACWDLHIILLIMEIVFNSNPGSKFLVPKPEYFLQQTGSSCWVSLYVLPCLADPWLVGLPNICAEGTSKQKVPDKSHCKGNTTSRASVPRCEPLVFQQVTIVARDVSGSLK